MLTKKQFAESFLKSGIDEDTFALLKNNKLSKGDIWKICLSSTCDGICLQVLGYLDTDDFKDLNDYLNERGGIYISYYGDVKEYSVLTMREMLNLLPD